MTRTKNTLKPEDIRLQDGEVWLEFSKYGETLGLKLMEVGDYRPRIVYEYAKPRTPWTVRIGGTDDYGLKTTGYKANEFMVELYDIQGMCFMMEHSISTVVAFTLDRAERESGKLKGYERFGIDAPYYYAFA